MLYPPEIYRKFWTVQIIVKMDKSTLCIVFAIKEDKHTHKTELAKEERPLIIFGENSFEVIKCGP